MVGRMMVMVSGGSATLHRCKVCPPDWYEKMSEDERLQPVPSFCSDRGAVDSGWVSTRDPRFVFVGDVFGWVCPDCARKHGLSRR